LEGRDIEEIREELQEKAVTQLGGSHSGAHVDFDELDLSAWSIEELQKMQLLLIGE